MIRGSAAPGDVDRKSAVGNTVQTNAGAVGGNAGCPGAEQASAVHVNGGGTVVAPVTISIAFYEAPGVTRRPPEVG